MRYLSLKSDKYGKYNFITGFQVDKRINKIIVYYANNTNVWMNYSEDQVKHLENVMKSQVLEAYKNIRKYKSELKSELLWELYNVWFMYYDISNMVSSDENGRKITFGLCGAGFLGLFIARLCRIEDRASLIKELKKYRYFIENEAIINYEAEHYYVNENSNSIDLNAPAKLTINDLDQISIQELEETVELIEKAHEDVDFKQLKMELD